MTSIITPEAVGALRGALRGAVLAPGQEGYERETAAFNLAVPQRPALVAVAEDAADIAAAVRFAARHDLPVAVQATGHGAVTRVEGALLIGTRRMDGVSVDPATATARIEAGALLSQVIEAAAPHGLAPLTGSAPGVGAVGYVLGGGLSPIGRTHGYAADHVRALEVVTADGSLRYVDAVTEPDLFWALRGGKGNFGVVTALTVGLFPIVSLYGGALYFDGSLTGPLLRAYRDWSSGLPETVTTSIALLRLPPLPQVPEPLRGRFSVAVRVACLGDRDEAEKLLAPIRAIGEPVLDGVGELPFAAIGMIHADPVDPMPAWERSLLFQDLPDAVLDALAESAGPDAEAPPFVVEIRQLGGALARQAAPANAVGGRSAAYSLLVVGPPEPEELTSLVSPIGRRVLDAVAPWSTGGSLPNFQGAATSPKEVALAWPADVHARLVALKHRYDPAGLFRFGHSLV
ncbi:FAD-binding oxidoreductase [Actinocorallia longicatena]|uniref:FAD-binding oxidoreductase n=1 Tax=Actinocorallia longicatena TaxID=111803 RepID=A0ABP6QJS0_9ACTN